MQEMQAHMQGYVGGNLPPPPPIEQVPSPHVENTPPVHVAATENVGEAGMDPELAAPPAPEIDLFAYENLGGFDMKVEENWGGVQMAPNMFAWANANADGFDPEGHGPSNKDIEVVSDIEDEEEPAEVVGSSGGTDSLSTLSSLAYAADQPHMEMSDENSVDLPPPPEVGSGTPAGPVVPPGQVLMTVNQDMLQAAMAQLGTNTAELNIYPYGG